MNERTLIVAVNDYAFQLAKNKQIYACPASYSGRDKGDYIAFYRTKPVQKITHYAKIEEIAEGDSEKLTAKDKLKMFPDMSATARIFYLEELEELTEPVEKGNHTAVQGFWYRELSELKKAKTLSEISSE